MSRHTNRVKSFLVTLAGDLVLLLASCMLATAQADVPAMRAEDAILLSPFGGRASFSPDGTRIAFVDKSYGDAFELDIANRNIRSLTQHIPHQGIMRIQYLPNGDFLVTAPRINSGPNSRAHLEMWLLDKHLKRGLQPLGEQVFEGIAVSRKRNYIAWTVIEPELEPAENWQMAFVRPTKRYTAEISYRNGVPQLTRKREIMAMLPRECAFIEPQDFRLEDSELLYSCMGFAGDGSVTISVMGNRLDEDRNITYYRKAGEYAEVEGVAPDGSWTTVECGKQDEPGLPPLDICRLELDPPGKMSRLVLAASPDSSRDVSNPVVSPDGNWLVFQRSDSATGEIGEGYGLYMMEIAE